MSDSNVHPDAGADDAALWAEAEARDAKSASSVDVEAETVVTAPAVEDSAQAVPAPAPEKTDPPQADPKETKAAPTAPAAAVVEDPWKDAPPALKAAHDRELAAALEKLATTETNYRRVSGTVSGLQRRINEHSRTATTPAPKKGTEAAAPVAPAPRTSRTASPEFKKAAEEYPEVYGPLTPIIEGLESELETARAQVGTVAAAHEVTVRNEEFGIAAAAHPDYLAVAGSQAFLDWYQGQPEYVRTAVERNADVVVNGNEVADIVGKFKLETGFKSPKAQPTPAAAAPAAAKPTPTAPAPDPLRQDQLESAAAPPGKPVPAASRADPNDEAALWREFDEMDRRAGQNR